MPSASLGSVTGIFYVLLWQHGSGTDTEKNYESAQKVDPGENSPAACGDSNPRPFDHESGRLSFHAPYVDLTAFGLFVFLLNHAAIRHSSLVLGDKLTDISHDHNYSSSKNRLNGLEGEGDWWEVRGGGCGGGGMRG